MKSLALYFAALSFCFSLSPLYAATAPAYDYLPENEVATITIGEKQSHALVRSWRGKHQYGAAILFSDFGTNADPSDVITFLRRHLNDKGWATISLSAPDNGPQVNHTTDASEVSKSGEKQLALKASKSLPKYSEEAWQKLREKQNEQLIQTMNQLDALGQPYPGKRILIASQKGAGLAITLLNAGSLPKPDILVIINPYLDRSEENQKLAQQIAELTIPVLDIQSPDASPEALATLLERKALAPQNQPLRYEQQVLALNLDQPSAWQEILVLVQGFAKRIMKAYP
ncbi:DUF3530 domain-containing protein [Shewanella colwelliana]|uniref:DUF3530 family protein n=1 Tax=Shewanella colwelliana TaxID=23 RepID=UPI001BC2B3D1|nr:DUF3530 family protein [Shewanella colwelliana]GIU16308.1 DUF3530 domain-containing protein [Shewanella colwelliana]